MVESTTDSNIDDLVQAFKPNPNANSTSSVKPEHHEQWMNNSVFFRQIIEDIKSTFHFLEIPFIFEFN